MVLLPYVIKKVYSSSFDEFCYSDYIRVGIAVLYYNTRDRSFLCQKQVEKISQKSNPSFIEASG